MNDAKNDNDRKYKINFKKRKNGKQKIENKKNEELEIKKKSKK